MIRMALTICVCRITANIGVFQTSDQGSIPCRRTIRKVTMTLIEVIVKALDNNKALVKYKQHCYEVEHNLVHKLNGATFVESRFLTCYSRMRVTDVRQSDLEWQRKARKV